MCNKHFSPDTCKAEGKQEKVEKLFRVSSD